MFGCSTKRRRRRKKTLSCVRLPEVHTALLHFGQVPLCLQSFPSLAVSPHQGHRLTAQHVYHNSGRWPCYSNIPAARIAPRDDSGFISVNTLHPWPQWHMIANLSHRLGMFLSVFSPNRRPHDSVCSSIAKRGEDVFIRHTPGSLLWVPASNRNF